jgi:hypothetical protein
MSSYLKSNYLGICINGVLYIVWYSTLRKAIVKIIFRYRGKAKCVLRAASRERVSRVDSKIVLR